VIQVIRDKDGNGGKNRKDIAGQFGMRRLDENINADDPGQRKKQFVAIKELSLEPPPHQPCRRRPKKTPWEDPGEHKPEIKIPVIQTRVLRFHDPADMHIINILPDEFLAVPLIHHNMPRQGNEQENT